MAVLQKQHADYIRQLASEASQLSTSASVQLAANQTQHSAQLAAVTSQHNAELASLQQQLADGDSVLRAEHASNVEFHQEEQKLMVSQLATFLAWEKDDAMLELRTSREAELSSLRAQHEQQLDSVQAKMIEQNVVALRAMSASSEAAAQGMIAQNADLTQDLSELHRIELESQHVAYSLRLEDDNADHAGLIEHLESEWELKMAEAKASHEAALAQALTSAAQDSEYISQSHVKTLLSTHAAELHSLTAEHQQHLAELTAQREQDQAESQSHLTQALEQLIQEHSHSLASAESYWTDACTDQQQLHQQQLLDLSMEHDSALANLTICWQGQLQAAQAQHDAELTHISSQHDSGLGQLREQAESTQQLHTVQLVNLQLELEQTERKLRAEVTSAQAEHATVVKTYAGLHKQLQVCKWKTHMQQKLRTV